MPPLNRFLDSDSTSSLDGSSHANNNNCLSFSDVLNNIQLSTVEGEDDDDDDDNNEVQRFKFKTANTCQYRTRRKVVVSFLFHDENDNSVNSDENKKIQQQVEYVDHHSVWSELERNSRWYSQEEYASFRKDVFSTLYMLRNHPEAIDGISYTARGIECRDPCCVGRRQHVKQQAWNAVFEEQQAQRKDTGWKSMTRGGGDDDVGVEGDAWMATLYSHAARPALREAMDFAAQDEASAYEYYSCQSGDQRNIKEDDFNDDWISSISSSSSEDSSSTCSHSSVSNEQCGFCVFGEASGFDDSWIREDL